MFVINPVLFNIFEVYPKKHTTDPGPPGRLSRDANRHKMDEMFTGGVKPKPQRQCRGCAFALRKGECYKTIAV